MFDALHRHPFLRLLIPLAAGIICADNLPFRCSVTGWLFALCIGIVLLILAHWRRLSGAYGVVLLSLLFILGYGATARLLSTTEQLLPPGTTYYRVVLQEDPLPKKRSFLCPSTLTGRYENDTLLPYTGEAEVQLYFPKSTETAALRQGDILLIRTRLTAPTNFADSTAFDYARYLKRKGVIATGYVAQKHWKVIGHQAEKSFAQQAQRMRTHILDLYRHLGFHDEALAVLSALTVGYREELSREIKETYSASGAMHVLAVSGLHIAILAGFCYLLLKPIWKRWKRAKTLLDFVLVGLMWGFAFLTGLSSSVVRAVTMFTLLALSQLQHERPITLNTLAATAFLMLLIKPLWLFDVGFQMSFCAVAAIVVIQPLLQAYWKPRPRLLRRGWSLVTVSVAAQIGVAPLLMLYFGRLSTHFLLTNIWVIPLVTLILYAAVVMLLFTPFPWLQYYIAVCVGKLIGWQNDGLRMIEELPLATIDNVKIDIWEVLLLYLCIGTLFRFLQRHTARRLHIALVVCLVTICYHYIHQIVAMN